MCPGASLCSGIILSVVTVLCSVGLGWPPEILQSWSVRHYAPTLTCITLTNSLDMPIDNRKIDIMLGKNNHLVLSSVFLEFDEKVDWDLTALSTDWALWLSQHNRVPVMSKVGIMSSLRFQQIVSPLISNKLASCFRLMMHTSSIIYSLGPQDSYCGIALDDFYTLRSHAGTHVLMGLERLIRPAELANASHDKLRVIFILLFWNILAFLYNERIEYSQLSLYV